MLNLINYGWDSDEATQAHSYLLPALLVLLPKKTAPLKILDIGCGNGWIAGQLAARGHEVVGMDASEDGINLAAAKYPDVRFEVRSIYDSLPPFGEGVDLVISSEVIEHLLYPRALLKVAHEALLDDGQFLLTTPYHGYLKNLALSLFDGWDKHHTVNWDGGHIKFFSRNTLATLLQETGFEVREFMGVGRVPWLWKSMIFRATKSKKSQ